MLSKLLKFGQPNTANGTNQVKSRSACFGSQFPEVNSSSSAVVPLYKSGQRTESVSVATQTVKCGSEDTMVTLIMKQAGRHALARSRSCGGQRSVERHNGSCTCSSRHHRESSRNGSKQSSNRTNGSTKYYHLNGENGDTHTSEMSNLHCQCNLTAEQLLFCHSAVSNGSNRRHNRDSSVRHNRGSKLRSASLRSGHHQEHYRPSEWLIDYSSADYKKSNGAKNNRTRKGVERTGRQFGGTTKNGKSRRGHSYSEDEEDEEDEEKENGEEHLWQHNGERQAHSVTNGGHFAVDSGAPAGNTCVLYPKINGINGHWSTNGAPQHYAMAKDAVNEKVRNGGNTTTTTNLLINNSLNLKIEIETSNSSRVQQQPNEVKNGSASSGHIHPHHHHEHHLLQQAKYLEHSTLQYNQQPNQEPYHHQFANDIYSELTFDRHSHQLSQVRNVNPSSGGPERFQEKANSYQFRPLPTPPPLQSQSSADNGGYNSDLNYSNSITALKEQIARAKANFFNSVPLSSDNSASTSTR